MSNGTHSADVMPGEHIETALADLADKRVEKISIRAGFVCRALERGILLRLEACGTKVVNRLIRSILMTTSPHKNSSVEILKLKLLCKGVPVLYALCAVLRFQQFAFKRMNLLLERDVAALKLGVERLKFQSQLPKLDHLVHEFRSDVLVQDFPGNAENITR